MVLPASDFFETGGPATAKTEGTQGSKLIVVATKLLFKFFIIIKGCGIVFRTV